MEKNDEKIKVEVAYALPAEQVIVAIEVPKGATVRNAIDASGILEKYTEIDLSKTNKIGIFGKLTKESIELRAGDRVEIYRPLLADPKEVRRRRAAEGKRMKKGGGDLTEAAETVS